MLQLAKGLLDPASIASLLCSIVIARGKTTKPCAKGMGCYRKQGPWHESHIMRLRSHRSSLGLWGKIRQAGQASVPSPWASGSTTGGCVENYSVKGKRESELTSNICRRPRTCVVSPDFSLSSTLRAATD